MDVDLSGATAVNLGTGTGYSLLAVAEAARREEILASAWAWHRAHPLGYRN